MRRLDRRIRVVRDFLGMTGIDSCDWKFVSDREIPVGPWRYGRNQFLSANLLQNSSR
jgi:hypothetical protein